MKALILLTVFGFAATLEAGVGGISGGHKNLQGGHINFQRESTFVHPVYSKTLCFDGSDFHAQIKKCAEWGGGDDERCVRYETIRAVQPSESTRERCAREGGRDGGSCQKWETVPFVQSPIRKVDVIQGKHVVKQVKVKVRSCR